MKPLKQAQEEFRATYIRSTYEACGRNKYRTAKVLKIDRPYLYKLLRTYHVETTTHLSSTVEV